jgi:hypothetical protein
MLRRSIPEGAHYRLNPRPARIANSAVAQHRRGGSPWLQAMRRGCAFPAQKAVRPAASGRRLADLSRYSSSVALSASAGDSQQWEPSRRKPSDWKRRA